MRTKRADQEQGNLIRSKRIYYGADHPSKDKKKGAMACTDCGAVFANGRWAFGTDIVPGDDPKVLRPAPVVCPACEQVRNGEPNGFLFVRGAFAVEHAREITNLVNNEAERMARENPLWRIMSWESSVPELMITTTTTHLAQHLGRALRGAFAGELDHSFSDDHTMVRVYWTRD